MTPQDGALIELARRFGVATEYDDWVGHRVDVPEHDPDRGARCARRPGRGGRRPRRRARAPRPRALEPGAAAHHRRARRHRNRVLGARHPRRPRRRLWMRLEDGTVRAGIRQLDNYTPPIRSRRPDGRRGHLRAARRPAAGLSPAAPAQRRPREPARRSSSLPPWLGLPAAARRPPGVGPGHPALQRPVRADPGASAISPT